jgi:hypothetical protein
VLALADAGVDFVVIGGVAAQVHGSAQLTFDLDVAYARSDENLARAADVLNAMHARLRGAPADVAFRLDARTLKAGAKFTFTTEYGSVDMLADPAAAPRYERLRYDSVVRDVDGRTVRFASIDHLIAMKAATGRDKDRRALTELMVLADEIGRRERARTNDS